MFYEFVYIYMSIFCLYPVGRVHIHEASCHVCILYRYIHIYLHVDFVFYVHWYSPHMHHLYIEYFATCTTPIEYIGDTGSLVGF